jgi:hypothetical protein
MVQHRVLDFVLDVLSNLKRLFIKEYFACLESLGVNASPFSKSLAGCFEKSLPFAARPDRLVSDLMVPEATEDRPPGHVAPPFRSCSGLHVNSLKNVKRVPAAVRARALSALLSEQATVLAFANFS